MADSVVVQSTPAQVQLLADAQRLALEGKARAAKLEEQFVTGLQFLVAGAVAPGASADLVAFDPVAGTITLNVTPAAPTPRAPTPRGL